jgi:hypothetical protein
MTDADLKLRQPWQVLPPHVEIMRCFVVLWKASVTRLAIS